MSFIPFCAGHPRFRVPAPSIPCARIGPVQSRRIRPPCFCSAPPAVCAVRPRPYPPQPRRSSQAPVACKRRPVSRCRPRPPPPSFSPVRLRPPEAVRLQLFAVFYICAAYPRALSYAAVSPRPARLFPSRPARRTQSPRSRRAPFVFRPPAPSHSGGIVRPARAGPLLCKNKQKFKPGRRPHHSADVVQNRL